MTHHFWPSLARSCLLAALALAACPTFAQWQWLDANGKKVFSDMAPPLDVPDKHILQSPGVRVTPPKSDTEAAPPSAPVANPTGAAASKEAAELEAKKKKAEDAERAQQRADADRAARAKTDNCQRAQRALITLNSGTPMRTMTAQGERVFMDETTRSAEKTRLQAAIRQNCN